MKDTETLISQLSSEAALSKPARTPRYWAVRIIAVLAIYSVGIQLFLGLRPDLGMQLTRPFFLLEILLLIALLITTIQASILSMYPDAYQKPEHLALPYGVFVLLCILLAVQLFLPIDPRMVIAPPGSHAMECAICIASVALIPSALLFSIMRKGASIRQFQAGIFAVLCASAIGGLTLRLAESNDSIMHLAYWHYIPTLLFAALGAVLGKQLLKW